MKLTSFISQCFNALYGGRSLCIVLWLTSFAGFVPRWSGGGADVMLIHLAISIIPAFVFAAMVGYSGGCFGRWVNALGWALSAVQMLLSVANVVAWAIWDMEIGSRMIVIALQTNADEAGSFFANLPSDLLSLAAQPLFWLFVAGTSALAVLVRRVGRKAFDIGAAAMLTVSAVCCAVFLHRALNTGHGCKNISLMTRTGVSALQTYTELRQLSMWRDSFETHAPAIPELRLTKGADNIVLVVGESSARHHWQLYGYPLPTTPRLLAMRDSLYVFDDIVPPTSSTDVTISHLFTQKDNESNTGEWYTYVDLLRLAKAAGYTTYWISTQEKVGRFIGCVPIVASCADSVTYMGCISEDDHELIYDDVLSGRLAQVLTDSARRRLVVLHTMGSHTAYADRTPDSRKPLKPTHAGYDARRNQLSDKQLQTVADYDNSIIYTDSLVAEMIGITSRSAHGATAFVYLSDHSEEVYDYDDHLRHATHGEFIKIPMVFWTNSLWRSVFSQTDSIISSRLNLPLESEDIFHALIGMTGIRCAVYDSCHDFGHEAFRPSAQTFVLEDD